MKNSFAGSWLLTIAFVMIAALTGCVGSGEKSGAYIDDAWITSKAMSEMIADRKVPARAIRVKPGRGGVTLSG